MRQGEYGAQRPRFPRQDYTRGVGGGRFYGDDDREQVYREEYGQGGVEYGDRLAGYDAGYSPSRAAYHRQGYGRSGYGGDGRTVSGGTGGYDYERGYGDGGRDETRGERFEDAGRNAGDFLHRAGEKVAAWFAGGGEGRAYEPDFDRSIRGNSHSGKGPSGYKLPTSGSATTPTNASPTTPGSTPATFPSRSPAARSPCPARSRPARPSTAPSGSSSTSAA